MRTAVVARRTVAALRQPTACGLRAAGRRHLCSSDQIVGLGYTSSALDVSRANLMREMMSAIDMPGRHVPGITSVKVQPAAGDAGEDGALWRRMIVNGEELLEHVYANPAQGEVRRVGLLKDGREGPLEIVSALLNNPLRIEVFQRDRDTLERMPYPASLQATADAVEAAVELARAMEKQQEDVCFFGSKA